MLTRLYLAPCALRAPAGPTSSSRCARTTAWCRTTSTTRRRGCGSSGTMRCVGFVAVPPLRLEGSSGNGTDALPLCLLVSLADRTSLIVSGTSKLSRSLTGATTSESSRADARPPRLPPSPRRSSSPSSPPSPTRRSPTHSTSALSRPPRPSTTSRPTTRSRRSRSSPSRTAPPASPSRACTRASTAPS